MKTKLLFALPLLTLLASCETPPLPLPDRTSVEIDASTPASLLLSLKEARNYTVDIAMYSISGGSSKLYSSATAYFDDFSYHFKTSSYDLGYIQGSEGVYPFSLQNGAVLPGEVLLRDDGSNVDSLWDAGLFGSFADFDAASLEGKGDSRLAITSKAGRLALLDIAGLDRTNYPSFSQVTAIVQNGALNITGYLTLDGGSYSLSYDVKDIQATADYVVSEFLEDGGKALVPEHELSRAKALMKGNNYTHLYYTESGKVGAYERFHEDYYLLSCGSELLSQGLIPTGMVGVNNKKDPATGKTLNGCYLATPSSGDAAGRDVTSVSVMQSFPYNSSTTSVVEAYNYPSSLILWDSLEFVSPYSSIVHEDMDKAYITSNAAIVYDFASNFGALAAFENAGSTPVALVIETSAVDAAGAEELYFTLLANTGNGMDFHFVDFGITEVPVMDEWLASLVDA